MDVITCLCPTPDAVLASLCNIRDLLFWLGVLAETNLALNQPAWCPYISPPTPPAKAVDGDVATHCYTGNLGRPFIGVDLGSSVEIGRVSLRFQWCKYRRHVLLKTILEKNIIRWKLNITFIYHMKYNRLRSTNTISTSSEICTRFANCLQTSWNLFQYLIRRLTVRSRKVSKPGDLYLEMSDHSEILQVHRQLPICLSNFEAMG